MKFELVSQTSEKIILQYSLNGVDLLEYKDIIKTKKYLGLIGIEYENETNFSDIIPNDNDFTLLLTQCEFKSNVSFDNINIKSLAITQSNFNTIKINDFKGEFIANECCIDSELSLINSKNINNFDVYNINVKNKLEIDECNINNFTLKNSRIEQDFILTNSNIKGCINLDKTTFLKPELAIIDFNSILNYTKDDMLTLINNNQITQEELYRTIIKLDNIAKACNDSFYVNKIHKAVKLIKCIMSENDIKAQIIEAKEIKKEDKNKGILKNIQIWGLVVLNSKNYIDEFLSDFNTNFVKNLNAIVGLIIVFGILNLLAYIFINFDIANGLMYINNLLLSSLGCLILLIAFLFITNKKLKINENKTFTFIILVIIVFYSIINIFYFPLFLLTLFVILSIIYLVISRFKKNIYFIYIAAAFLLAINPNPIINIFKLDFLPKYTQEALNEIKQDKLTNIIDKAFSKKGKQDDSINKVYNAVRDFFIKPPKHINDYQTYIFKNKYKVLVFANEVPEKDRDDDYYKLFKSLYIDIQLSLTYCILYLLLLVGFTSLGKTWKRN
ncbi:APC family permease [Campylobacter sp. Cr9]|uniref:hypothetical protein n=1 Tax=Campylobacter sp. Cr9 TaxID=2735728 RepID=UPI0030146596|nr:APC family permease [Campylobacter sp. Cr9]